MEIQLLGDTSCRKQLDKINKVGIDFEIVYLEFVLGTGWEIFCFISFSFNYFKRHELEYSMSFMAYYVRVIKMLTLIANFDFDGCS